MTFNRGSVALLVAAVLGIVLACASPVPAQETISYYVQDSGPTAPLSVDQERVDPQALSLSAFMLQGVPTSSWTYGCSATSAGMLFGYYDRHGLSNMYAGPANGGVAPLTSLGNQCSIIATKNGFDGRTTKGHVDDYWISYRSGGPDPFEGHWTEHAWSGCTADFMGTNQWKWDYDRNGVRETNIDGGTIAFHYNSASKLYDYIPSSSYGLPRTELCHGLRLFAESRGYTVLENYTQMSDARYAGGFSFANYVAEINAGRPVLIQLEGHTMVGVGYDPTGSTVYVHDTWGDYVGSMTWGGSYSGMSQWGVTVINVVPEPASLALLVLGGLTLLRWRRMR